jgi:hypothetical protein
MRMLLFAVLSCSLAAGCGAKATPCSEYQGLDTADESHDHERVLLPAGGEVCGVEPGIGLTADYTTDLQATVLAVVSAMESDGWKRTEQSGINSGFQSVSFERRTRAEGFEQAHFYIQKPAEVRGLTTVMVRLTHF